MNTYLAADTIRTLREARALTQRELATAVGVTDKAVSKWESGRGLPDISLIEGLAAALGVSVSAALDRHAHLDCARVLSIVSTVLIAASLDEVIQLFVPGRCGQVADVLLDCMGAITGVAASSFVRRRIAKRSIS